MAWPIIATVAGSLLSSFLSGQQQNEAQQQQLDYMTDSKNKARKYLADYGYEGYKSPYEDFFNNLINVYGSGNLTKSQEDQINKVANDGASSIATVMANRGGTIGGQLAATEKLNNNLASQRLALSDQNVNTALNVAQARDSFNLSDWLNQQNSIMRQKELLAQYS